MNLYNQTLHKAALQRRKLFRGLFNKGWKAREIADAYKISRQRVEQIASGVKK